MDWYIVVKTINGRRYRYRQKTWRENGRVRTRSEYIGPVDSASSQSTPAARTQLDPVVVDEVYATLTDANFVRTTWGVPWDLQREGDCCVQRVDAIDRLLNTLKVTLREANLGAFYRPFDDSITLPPMRAFTEFSGQSATQNYYGVLLHELVHATGSVNRLRRRDSHTQLGYAREELVAESAALLLLKHFGIASEDSSRHTGYFQTWLARAGHRDRALQYVRKEALRAVRYILEHGIIPK